MRLSSKTILIVSPEHWDHIFVSKHHYAIHLSMRGNKVFFLNPPSDVWSCSESKYPNLFIVNYSGFIPGMRFLPKFIRRCFTRLIWNKIQIMCGRNFDIIWSFDNSVFFDLDVLPKEVLKISHIVDLNQNFMTETAAKTADICLGVTSELVIRASKFNTNSYFINHGYNQQICDQQVVLPGTSRCKAIYIGNLAMQYLDWNLLLMASQKFKGVDYIFVGPNGDNFNQKINHTHQAKKKLINQVNVFFLPKIDSRYISSYLESCSICLISYQKAHLLDQSNSHKMLEYLGSGKPIVATYTKEYAIYPELIYMSRQNSEWLDKLAVAIENEGEQVDKALFKKRRALALNNTYDKQIDRIESLINNIY